MTERVEQLLVAYVQGRAEERRLRAEMHGKGRCEWQESDDHGDGGRPPCYQCLTAAADEWCETCRTRDPLFHQLVVRRRANRVLLRRLEKAALVVHALPPVVEEPKPLLGFDDLTSLQQIISIRV